MGRKHDVETGAYRARLPPPPPPPLLHQPRPWCVWLVPLMFVADVAIFVYSMYINDCPSKTGPSNCLLYDRLGRFSFQPIKENPLIGPSVNTLRDLGALDRKLVVQNGQGWRLLSCMWLHAGVVHLVTNMFSLLFIGVRLEQEFGFLKIGLLYVLSGFGGSLVSALNTTVAKPTISVGASGALFGLLGAMLSELITNWTIYANKCAALFTLLLIIAINLAIGLLPRVDNSAHIGGFLSGLFLGFILLIRPQYGYVNSKFIPAGYQMKHKKSKYKCYQYCLWITSLIILIVGYMLGMIEARRETQAKKGHLELEASHRVEEC